MTRTLRMKMLTKKRRKITQKAAVSEWEKKVEDEGGRGGRMEGCKRTKHEEADQGARISPRRLRNSHASGKCTQTGLLAVRLLMPAPGEQVLYSVVNGAEEEGKQSMYTRLGPNARHRMRNDVYAGLPSWTANE